MSSLAMSTTEQQEVDKQVSNILGWAESSKFEAEQLAMDATRLLSCTSDRLDKIANQGFFIRCWSKFSGASASADKANTKDLIQMQKVSLRYINMLQEEGLLLAHSMLTLKNNLFALSVKETETRDLITRLAQRTLDRFHELESRVDQLEISSNLNSWLLVLEEKDYDEKIPTENMRIFRVINDYYNIKNDNWNCNDLLFMRKAIRTIGVNPKRKISLNSFIDQLVDEIQNESVGFGKYSNEIAGFSSQNKMLSQFAIDNISSPVFIAMHNLRHQYLDRLDILETLQDEMNMSLTDALKLVIKRGITNLNVNLDYEFPLAETAIEILGCLRLLQHFFQENTVPQARKDESIEVKNTNKEEKSIDNDVAHIIEEARKENLPPLHYAVLHNHHDKIKLLLETGVNTEEKDKDGYTALMFAVDLNSMEIINVLLEYGADSNAFTVETDEDGNESIITPLFIAVYTEHIEATQILLEYGAKLNCKINSRNVTIWNYISTELTRMLWKARLQALDNLKATLDKFMLSIHEKMILDFKKEFEVAINLENRRYVFNYNPNLHYKQLRNFCKKFPYPPYRIEDFQINKIHELFAIIDKTLKYEENILAIINKNLSASVTSNKKNLFVRNCSSNFPFKKIHKFSQSIGLSCDSLSTHTKSVLAYFDTTFFGSGETGILLSKSGIYFINNSSKESGFIFYNLIKEISKNERSIDIIYADELRLNVEIQEASDKIRSDIFYTLKKIVEYVHSI